MEAGRELTWVPGAIQNLHLEPKYLEVQGWSTGSGYLSRGIFFGVVFAMRTFCVTHTQGAYKTGSGEGHYGTAVQRGSNGVLKCWSRTTAARADKGRPILKVERTFSSMATDRDEDYHDDEQARQATPIVQKGQWRTGSRWRRIVEAKRRQWSSSQGRTKARVWKARWD